MPLDPVLVTGGSGFIGACVTRRLFTEGASVHALVPPASSVWRLADLLGRLPIHEIDLADGAELCRLLEDIRPSAVIHLATHGAYEWQGDGRRILETVVRGTFELLEASAAAGVRVLVNAGSSSEYGSRREAMRECDRIEPNSIYAVAKAAQTHLCSLAARRGGMSIATLRLFSVYGPWEAPGRLFPTLLRRAQAGLPLEMAAPETARDFVYVDDVVDALVDLERLAGLEGQVYNLGSGVQSTLRDVVAAVQAAVGRSCEVRWGAMPSRQWDTDRWQADATKARELLGWTARRSLPEGVSLMARWMEEHGALYDAAH